MSRKKEKPTPDTIGPRQIDANALALELEQDGQLLLLDVRTAMEFAGGHVPGAQNRPLDQLATWSAELDKKREIFLICRSGSRSGSAADQLAKAGFSVVNVKGGMMGWKGQVERVASWSRLFVPGVVMIGLGLAPFAPEPHLVEKIRWVARGASGMAALDWFDLVMHGAPVLWFAWSLVRLLQDRAAAAARP